MFAEQGFTPHQDNVIVQPAAVELRGGTISAEPDELLFGRFLLVPSARLLLRQGSPITLGSRAFDLLVVLVRASGKLVSKDEIVRHVWPTTTVDESNLRFQVASLRRALGQDRDLVKTIPGRGYFFAASVSFAAHNASSPPAFSVNVSAPLMSMPVEPTAEALKQFFRSAGQLVAAYGSIDALLDALQLTRISA